MEDVLKVGETYPFQILELNPAEHRMSLKLAPPLSSEKGEGQDAALETESPQPTPEPEQVSEEK